MSLDVIVASLLGAAVTTIYIFSQAEMWQRKEYRLDRMRAAWLGDQGLMRWSTFVGLTLLALAWMAVSFGTQLVAEGLAWAALLAFFVYSLWEIFRYGVARPAFTLKAIVLLGVEVLLVVGYVRLTFVPTIPVPLQWATLPVVLAVAMPLLVVLVNAPFAVHKQQIIHQALKLRQSLAEIVVVGITGSYGKTSTKHYLAQLLGDESTVRATAEHRNSVVAVAQDMLRHVTAKTRIYVAEMGAYRRGEIREVAQLVQPRIGVVTAIGNQHLHLFGSREVLAAAKWELIEALPADGVAVLNADDPFIVERGKKVAQRVVWYSLQRPANVYWSQLQILARAIRGKLHIGEAEREVTIPLLGEAAAACVAAAVAAAYALGRTSEEMYSRVRSLKAYPRTMELVAGRNGAVVIDDSYSANEAGVVAAVAHLDRFSEAKKVMVMVPLIELGTEAARVHEHIGQALACSGAQVYVYGDTYSHALRRGARLVREDFSLHVVAAPRALVDAVVPHVSAGTVVLLEGRVPDVLRRAVI